MYYNTEFLNPKFTDNLQFVIYFMSESDRAHRIVWTWGMFHHLCLACHVLNISGQRLENLTRQSINCETYSISIGRTWLVSVARK